MTTVIGTRHEHEDGRVCLCGCQFVVGLVGSVVQDSDTPKLAALGTYVATFTIPSLVGGPSREQLVAYDLPRGGP